MFAFITFFIIVTFIVFTFSSLFLAMREEFQQARRDRERLARYLAHSGNYA